MLLLYILIRKQYTYRLINTYDVLVHAETLLIFLGSFKQKINKVISVETILEAQLIAQLSMPVDCEQRKQYCNKKVHACIPGWASGSPLRFQS